jgi:hypothetical protein
MSSIGRLAQRIIDKERTKKKAQKGKDKKGFKRERGGMLETEAKVSSWMK